MSMRYALVVLILGSGLMSGCVWKRMERFDTAYRGPDPVYPIVISPVRTDITGEPYGAGAIDVDYLPLPTVVRYPDGTLGAAEISAGEPLIIHPDDLETIVPDGQQWITDP